MTAYSSTCQQCRQHCDWVGAWMHQVHADHTPVIDWQPMERLDDNGQWVPV